MISSFKMINIMSKYYDKLNYIDIFKKLPKKKSHEEYWL